ncbi:HNH endonuclease [Candidatus Dojkabacteria bacterium]|jgi:hypothetical protein|nr:HNH endonuclease [Candidatus Dojkabacteria bacterium]
MIKICEYCGKEMILRTIKKGKKVGQILKIDKNKRFCCVDCLNKWQKNVSWEERIGKDNAEKIRKDASNRVSGEKNPSCNKDIAKKISLSLKKYLKDNPRYGEKNSFFGKKHTNETKKYLSDSKKNKWSYDDNGYKKLCENAKKGKEHPNWKNGSSITPYIKFTKTLKLKIKKLDNFTCAICGKQNDKLAVHHIDYNKLNYNETNLVSLCLSCHSKTNFNRDKWQIFFDEYVKNRKL